MISDELTPKLHEDRGCAYLLQLSDAIQDQAITKIASLGAGLLIQHLRLDDAHVYQVLHNGKSFIRLTGDSTMVAAQENNFGLTRDQQLQLKNGNYVAVDDLLYIPVVDQQKFTALLIIRAMGRSIWSDDDIFIARQTIKRICEARARAQQLQSLRDSEEKHRILFHSMDEGYCIIEMIYDAEGVPVDWRFLQVNPAFERHNGLKHAQGKTIKELAPGIEQKWMFIYDSVAQSGKPLRFEESSIALGRIFSLYAFRMKGEQPHVAVIFTDVSAQRRAEAALKLSQENYRTAMEREVVIRTTELQTSKAQLQLVFDTTLVQLSILEAVRDDAGEIQDFRIKLVNRELDRETGYRNLVGKLYSEEFPLIRETGLFDIIAKAVTSGVPQQTEYLYPLEEQKWYACMFVSSGDTVVASYLDITAKKQSEEEQYKNFVLLRQCEDIAQLGSWDYSLGDGTLRWSEGMYRLFGLENGSEVSPFYYLQYATEDSRLIAERIIYHIVTGNSSYQETLELEVDGEIKTIQARATVIYDVMGRPERVLGTDVDISTAHAAQEKLKRLEAERQHEIVKVTFSALEEERRRISENLHNGLAQLLYGIKVSLQTLSPADRSEAFEKQLTYAGNLLSEAIAENRRISHELMPPILEEFGLAASIRDIAKKLQQGVKFSYRLSGVQIPLEKYLELAIYRTVQELMMNVVKHSGATKAMVEVAIKPKSVLIRVRDNGCGIDSQPTSKAGIGLVSIRSKMKLLNGNMEIRVPIEGGTEIEINIPINSEVSNMEKAAG